MYHIVNDFPLCGPLGNLLTDVLDGSLFYSHHFPSLYLPVIICSQAMEKNGNQSHICGASFHKKASKVWAVHSSFRIAIYQISCDTSWAEMHFQSRDYRSEEKPEWFNVYLIRCYDQGNNHWGKICFLQLISNDHEITGVAISCCLYFWSLVMNFRLMLVSLVSSRQLVKLYGVRITVRPSSLDKSYVLFSSLCTVILILLHFYRMQGNMLKWQTTQRMMAVLMQFYLSRSNTHSVNHPRELFAWSYFPLPSSKRVQ